MKHAATLIRRVRALATEYPEGLYIVDNEDNMGDECSYTKGRVKNGPVDTFGCLIGQAARDYIVIPIEADRHGIISVLDDLEVEGTKAERKWLEDVQGEQDVGKRWAEAITEADRRGRRNP